MQRWIQTLKPTWWSGLGMLVLALGASGHAMAATITVDTLGDGNTGCTLRRALANANAANQGAAECTRGDTSGNEIRFNAAAQTIVLTPGNGPLVIQRNLTITGNGAASTSISGGGQVRVLDIPVGSSVTLALNGLTVQSGKALASSSMSNAGGLFIPVGSTANLSNCAFRNNDAQSSGGAIENRGALTINACTFTGNTAAGEGGAIRNIGTMTVDGSLFNSNTADRGGAVWVNRTAVTNIDLLNSKFGANTGGSTGGAVVLGTAVMNATSSSATLTTTGSVSQGQAYPESPPTITVQPTTPVTVGSAATLSVTLTGGATPTGTVSLLSGVDAIAGCSNMALTNGTASCSPATLVVGVHTITAQYPGDSNYLAGTSAGVAQVINGSTNQDTKQVTVSGPQNAEVWVDSANKGTITASGKLTVTLDTPAPDGNKNFLVETKTAGGGATLVTGTLAITRDGTPPVFSNILPADNGFLGASSTVGYTLSEDVVAGATIVFTRTGGAADPTPHTCTLQGTALVSGARQIAYAANANGCSTALNLVSNAIYSIAFSGTDKAGNPSATAPVTGVTYDTTAPTASLTLPATSTSRTITVAAGAFSGSDTGSGIAAAGYCLQESNASASCVWGAVPTSYAFGSDGNKTLYGFVKDNAGNVSAVVPAATASVLVDSSVPVAPTLATTPTYAIGNSTALTVQSAENGLQVWLGNSNTGQVIAGGTASITINTSGIANGQQATFRITLRDAAGNVSAELVLPLTRDSTAPVFSATTPANNAAIKANATLGFTLSKTVTSARITATQTGGTADGASPHTCTLQGTALDAGAHGVALTADANGCTAPLGLVDGAIYTFAFDATDAASNAAVTASITGVKYDTSAPATPVVTTPVNNASGEGSSLAISGTAEAGSRVEVYEAATLLGSATATGGNFSVTVAGLSFALHNFTLKAIDAAGNESGTTALAYTAQVPSGGSNPPNVVTQGSVAVVPGSPVIVGGSVQVTATPGSTITLTPQSGGSTITLPPAGSGGTPAPVTLVIGGQTFSIQPQPNTATVLSVVTLIGANGQPQVALVLNPSTSGDSQVTLSGTVSQGTVVALLSTTTGNLPLTALGDGAVSVTLITTPRAAAGTPQSWSVFVRTGRVALPPATNGAAAVTVYSGEVARLDGAGKVQSVRLGTVAGTGLGDPVQRGDLPAGINANVGFARLTGVPTRTGGSTLLETLVNNGLHTVGITSSAQSSDGSIMWNLGGVSIPVVPLEVRVAPGRADGVSVADDGSIEVATAGLVTRFGPVLQSLPAMGQALTALGATTVMQPNGALRVSLGTTVFHMRAQWLPMGRTGNAPGFVFSSTAGLVFTDASGVSQALQGDVADYDGLTSLLQSILGATTVLRTGLDLQTELIVAGQRFQLVPDLALMPAGTGPADSNNSNNWWFEGGKLFVRYAGGLVQGFAVTAR